MELEKGIQLENVHKWRMQFEKDIVTKQIKLTVDSTRGKMMLLLHRKTFSKFSTVYKLCIIHYLSGWQIWDLGNTQMFNCFFYLRISSMLYLNILFWNLKFDKMWNIWYVAIHNSCRGWSQKSWWYGSVNKMIDSQTFGPEFRFLAIQMPDSHGAFL